MVQIHMGAWRGVGIQRIDVRGLLGHHGYIKASNADQ
jgi:hypothetical protein